MHDGPITEYPGGYQGHGLREEAEYFSQLIQRGEKESSLLSLDETIQIMESLDEIRRQIGLIYPSEK